jgi:hypothetical protein
MKIPTANKKLWHIGVQSYLLQWVIEHRDMKTDTWTPEQKVAVNAEGVWQ